MASLLGPDGKPLGRESEPGRTVEIVRSFSFKLNLKNADGSPAYEDASFFCSKKSQCLEEDQAEVSRGLYDFCMEEVLQDIMVFKARRASRISPGRAA